MIGYVTVGTNNLERAVDFYDSLFDSINSARFMETDKFVAWILGDAQCAFSVTKPYNNQPATVGNGTMIGIMLESDEKVTEFYRKALSLGATCEGEPGIRDNATGYFAGYFRDLDGNKLNAFHIEMLF